MGTNKRYAEQIDQRMSDRILERVVAGGALATLTSAELQLGSMPVTKDPRPRVVKAWVRFGSVPVQVEAEACMWTSRAVAIRFRVSGKEFRCWVWSGAIAESE